MLLIYIIEKENKMKNHNDIIEYTIEIYTLLLHCLESVEDLMSIVSSLYNFYIFFISINLVIDINVVVFCGKG